MNAPEPSVRQYHKLLVKLGSLLHDISGDTNACDGATLYAHLGKVTVCTAGHTSKRLSVALFTLYNGFRFFRSQ